MNSLYHVPNCCTYWYTCYSTCQYSPHNTQMFRSGSPIMAAEAKIIGGPLAPDIVGTVLFRDVPGGTMVCVNVKGLPAFKAGSLDTAPVGPFGFHLHETGNCEIGDPKNPFAAAGGHWNPTNQPHGNHAGDFSVIFSNAGKAFMCFFTNKFKAIDIIGKAVIIHQNPDDYRSQPSGNAGKRLACGLIVTVT